VGDFHFSSPFSIFYHSPPFFFFPLFLLVFFALITGSGVSHHLWGKFLNLKLLQVSLTLLPNYLYLLQPDKNNGLTRMGKIFR